MTYQDIHSVRAFHEQIVIAVKAPAETRLDVPAPREVGNLAVASHAHRSCSKPRHGFTEIALK